MSTPTPATTKYTHVMTPRDYTEEGAVDLVRQLNQKKNDVELVGEPGKTISLPGLDLQGSLSISGGSRLVFLADEEVKVAGGLRNPEGEVKTWGNLKVGGDCVVGLLHGMDPACIEIGGDCRTNRLWVTHAKIGGSAITTQDLIAGVLEVGKDVVVTSQYGIIAKRVVAGGDVLSDGNIQGDHFESQNGQVLAKANIEAECDIIAAKGVVSTGGNINVANLIDASKSPVFAAGSIRAGGVIRCSSVGAGMNQPAPKLGKGATVSCFRLEGRLEQGHLHEADVPQPKASDMARAQLRALQMEAAAKLRPEARL